MSYESFFWAKTHAALFLSFENWTKHCKGSHWNVRNWRANHVGIHWQVSSCEKLKLDTCNRTPTWSRADNVTNRYAENNHDREFCYRYDYDYHYDYYKTGWFKLSFLYLCQQALPYVTLLIMLMFFMYAVIGMQVSWSLHDSLLVPRVF